MDNPQHYQPLSHALNPPVAGSSQPQSQYTMFPSNPNGVNPQEEEEEEDDGDEGVVEEQLHEERKAGSASPGETGPTDNISNSQTAQSQQHDPSETPSPEKRRRPGRPKGSKNRKRDSHTQGKHPQPGFITYPPQPLHPTGSGSAPPVLPNVNAQNQQYYEFQWRVLNLCAEFYGAAEELVKATPPLVVAQCYQIGPGSKVDPIAMLNEAKRNCDQLLANPSRLIANPPPPLFPIIPTFNPQAASTATASSNKGKAALSTPQPVITDPQSFVVSLGQGQTQPQSSPQASYPGMYPPQYPTTPYYQYPGAGLTYPGFYSAPQTTPQPQIQPHTIPAAAPGVNQGSWSDEETERLKKLAEESKGKGTSGPTEIEWDWVIAQWGNGRTRHQILIKATSMGLKESSSRGTKRRRDTETAAPEEIPAPPPPAQPSHTGAAPTTATTNLSTSTASTPVASPALANIQGTPSTPASASKPNLPWPMPTVAVNTSSPVIAPSTIAEAEQANYYQARPTQTPSAGSASTSRAVGAAHPYLYQPNGNRKEG